MTPLPYSERGQATVELVALLPLLAVVGVTVFAVIAAASAAEHAGQAAEAGAVALLQDGDAAAGARAALPARVRGRARVDVAARRVTVEVRPTLPLGVLEAALTARATADAGPEPAP